MHNISHGNNDDGLWRSDSARLLAQKVANSQATYDSLAVNVNIDNILANRDPAVLALTVAAIDAEMPFILHASFEHHVMIIPKTGAIVTYTNGAKTSVQFLKGKNFQNAVRMCVFIYPMFYIPVTKDTLAPPPVFVSDFAAPLDATCTPELRQQMLDRIPRKGVKPHEKVILMTGPNGRDELYQKGKGGIVPGPVPCQHEWALPISTDIMDCDLMLPDPFNDTNPNDYPPIE